MSITALYRDHRSDHGHLMRATAAGPPALLTLAAGPMPGFQMRLRVLASERWLDIAIFDAASAAPVQAFDADAIDTHLWPDVFESPARTGCVR